MENKQKIGNPAVVGLAGFGLTTLLLQFHNIGISGLGPVVAMAFIFGGFAQLIAGFMEQKTGNNFGFAAFSTYGAFWIGLGIIWILNNLKIYKSSHIDIGLYLLGFTILTAIFWIGSLFINKAMNTIFSLLLLGFILLVIGHLINPIFNIIAGYELILCTISAWYLMASIIINDVSGKELLKVGTPWIKLK